MRGQLYLDGDLWVFLWPGQGSVFVSVQCFCLDVRVPEQPWLGLVWRSIIYVHGRTPGSSRCTCSPFPRGNSPSQMRPPPEGFWVEVELVYCSHV